MAFLHCTKRNRPLAIVFGRVWPDLCCARCRNLYPRQGESWHIVPALAEPCALAWVVPWAMPSAVPCAVPRAMPLAEPWA